MDFDASNAPSDVVTVDVENLVADEIAVEGRVLEIVGGPDTSPTYGDIVVKLVGSEEWRTITNVDPGWEHPMQIVRIKKTGSTVTKVRVWK